MADSTTATPDATDVTGRPRRSKGKAKTRKGAKSAKRPGGKTAARGQVDYAARAAKIVAARDKNVKAGLGSVRVQRAFAKAMRKAAGL